MSSVNSSTVFLEWFRRFHDKPVGSSSSGVVWRCEGNAFHILCTAHQVWSLFTPSEIQNFRVDSVGVKVTLFDGRTLLQGAVTHIDADNDLCSVTAKFDHTLPFSPPYCFVKPALMTKEDLYAGQAIESIHHPQMQLHPQPASTARFQYTEGYIVDPDYQSSGKVHFYLPQIMPGSSGAPLFDAKSKRLVCMVRGCDLGTSLEGRLEQRLDGFSPTKIVNFIRLQIGSEPHY